MCKQLLSICVVACATGCALDPGEAISLFYAQIGHMEDQRRAEAGAAECQGQPCALDKWVPFVIASDGATFVGPVINVPCSRRVTIGPLEPPEDFVITGSVRPTDDLRVALVTRLGRLHLFDFGSPVPQATLAIGAAGVGWSNAGDRLAVAVQDGQRRVQIYSSELELLQEFPTNLPDVPLPDGYFNILMVSWSPDDTRLAVSFSNGQFPADLAGAVLSALIDLRTGDVRLFELTNVFFVAPDILVATPGDCLGAGCVRQFTLQDGQLVQGARFANALATLTSHPPSGVFVTEDEPSPVAGGLATNHVGLRTLTAGPDFFAFGGAISLVPRDTALPVLEATGFGPNDAPQPDPVTGACPE